MVAVRSLISGISKARAMYYIFFGISGTKAQRGIRWSKSRWRGLNTKQGWIGRFYSTLIATFHIWNVCGSRKFDAISHYLVAPSFYNKPSSRIYLVMGTIFFLHFCCLTLPIPNRSSLSNTVACTWGQFFSPTSTLRMVSPWMKISSMVTLPTSKAFPSTTKRIKPNPALSTGKLFLNGSTTSLCYTHLGHGKLARHLYIAHGLTWVTSTQTSILSVNLLPSKNINGTSTTRLFQHRLYHSPLYPATCILSVTRPSMLPRHCSPACPDLKCASHGSNLFFQQNGTSVSCIQWIMITHSRSPHVPNICWRQTGRWCPRAGALAGC